MALINRPIIPKQPKIKNTQLIKWYRSNHKQCEVCALDGITAIADDLHHILSNYNRSDLLWNIIMLCRNHHIQATEHINPISGRKLNIVLFAIKFLKNEIGTNTLLELDIYFEVMLAVNMIEKQFEQYKKGTI